MPDLVVDALECAIALPSPLLTSDPRQVYLCAHPTRFQTPQPQHPDPLGRLVGCLVRLYACRLHRRLCYPNP